MGNALYYGDNLAVLRDSIAGDSVDLVYLDPPFNSQANYNVLFKGPSGKGADAQIEAFEDTWHWGEEAERAFSEVLASPSTQAAELLRAMRPFLGVTSGANLTLGSRALRRHARESGHPGATNKSPAALDPRLRGGDDAKQIGNHPSGSNHQQSCEPRPATPI